MAEAPRWLKGHLTGTCLGKPTRKRGGSGLARWYKLTLVEAVITDWEAVAGPPTTPAADPAPFCQATLRDARLRSRTPGGADEDLALRELSVWDWKMRDQREAGGESRCTLSGTVYAQVVDGTRRPALAEGADRLGGWGCLAVLAGLLVASWLWWSCGPVTCGLWAAVVLTSWWSHRTRTRRRTPPALGSQIIQGVLGFALILGGVGLVVGLLDAGRASTCTDTAALAVVLAFGGVVGVSLLSVRWPLPWIWTLWTMVVVLWCGRTGTDCAGSWLKRARDTVGVVTPGLLGPIDPGTGVDGRPLAERGQGRGGKVGSGDGRGDDGNSKGSGSGGADKGSGSGGADKGSGSGGADKGSGSGGADKGSGSGGADKGSGSGGGDKGSGSGGSDKGSGSGGADKGTGSGGADKGTGSGGADKGSGSGGADKGTGSGGADKGSGSGGADKGSGSGGAEKGSGSGGADKGSGSGGADKGTGSGGADKGSGSGGADKGSGSGKDGRSPSPGDEDSLEAASEHRESVENALSDPRPFLDGTTRITLAGDLLFAFDEDQLRPEAEPKLRQVAQLLRLNPRQRAVLEGHADTTGGEQYNQDLSERRAQAVRSWLVEKAHLNPSQLDTVGYGSARPLVPASRGPAAQAPNRRVEVRIMAPGP